MLPQSASKKKIMKAKNISDFLEMNFLSEAITMRKMISSGEAIRKVRASQSDLEEAVVELHQSARSATES